MVLITHNITNKQQLLQDETKLEVLTKQSLPLAFNSGKFYEWNDSNNKKTHAGVFTTTTNQSYWLNKDGTFENLNFQTCFN